MIDDSESPQGAIRQLDLDLAKAGQTINLRQGPKHAPTATATVRASVRGLTPDELVGDITQNDSKVILSATALQGWTIPKLEQGDAAEINGNWRRIEVADPIIMNDVIVRWRLVVKG